MKNIISILAFLTICSVTGFAQTEDTTVVQVIEFSDGLDNRRAWRYFPPDTADYRKVLMYQTLKCDPSLINNPTNSGCGEWDTGENFYIFDHSYKDSLRYRVGFEYPDSINVRNSPTYSTYENYQAYIVYDAVTSEASYSVGAGSSALTNALQTSLHTSRAQYMYKESELTAAGVTAGLIDKIEIDITALGLTTLENFQIRMKNSVLTDLTTGSYETDGLSSVYHLNTTISATGIHTFNLTQPFSWDGTSNIVIDLSFSNDAAAGDFTVNGHATAFSSSVSATQDDRYYEMYDRSYIDVETSNLETLLDSNITVSFWVETNLEDQNGHLVVFSATDTSNIYQLLTYLPTTNPRVHWYAGRELGGGLDEIKNPDNLPNFDDFNDGWTNWAFTRNSATTVMTVYRNGEVYLQETTGNSNRLLNMIHTFRIAGDRSSNNRFYRGKMNEFRIWNKSLDQTVIQDWMYKDVDVSHPDHSDLIGYFKFDAAGNVIPIDETGNSGAAAFGLPSKFFIPGSDRFRNLTAASERPNINFIQGTYTTHIDSNLVVTTVENPSISIVVSQNYQDLGEVGSHDIESDSVMVWEAAYSYT